MDEQNIKELAEDNTFLELVTAAHYNDSLAIMPNSHPANARNRDTLLAAIALQQGVDSRTEQV